ncbi:MAG: hypothetical protein GF330_09945 [Candidatus Eisenbacteria bacterium]|nr:hypothetical protein [Candidatus Eisenbacteria bacterium]
MIREAQTSDIPALLEIENASFREDRILGGELYRRIIGEFIAQIERA